jgi:hypothetical protein
MALSEYGRNALLPPTSSLMSSVLTLSGLSLSQNRFSLLFIFSFYQIPTVRSLTIATRYALALCPFGCLRASPFRLISHLQGFILPICRPSHPFSLSFFFGNMMYSTYAQAPSTIQSPSRKDLTCARSTPRRVLNIYVISQYACRMLTRTWYYACRRLIHHMDHFAASERGLIIV